MGKSVLIVEDETLIAQSLELCLADAGFRVLKGMASGKDAIRAAKAERPDIILMDVRLRGAMNGFEAMAEIRAHSKVPVIFLTGGDSREVEEYAKRTAPNDFVIKPFDTNLLVRKMKKLLGD